MRELTETSYAILGLLAVRPWTTYELATQVERGMRNFWPRASSTLYEEPKKLVAHGLASARRERTGRRPRTVYSITAKGRRALSSWLAEPGRGPELEFEAVLKAFLAEHGDLDSLRKTLAAAVAWAEGDHHKGRGIAAGYLEGPSFPGRMHVISLVYPFLWDFAALVARWARWAEGEIEAWSLDASSGGIRTDLFERAAASKPGDDVELLRPERRPARAGGGSRR